MDMIDKLNDLALRARRQHDRVATEEAAKTAFVLPFLQALGYDVFNPAEVVPELTADHGVKKGEKVDYAVKQDGVITMLLECKNVGADLSAKCAAQLFRYFAVTDAKFGITTDGIRYLFFSDLEKPNKMDERPFFIFDLFNFDEAGVEELKKFSKPSFDLDTILSTASNLKYRRGLVAEIAREFQEPSDDFVKMLAARVYEGRLTQQVRAQFQSLIHQAFHDFVRGRLDARLKLALEEKSEQPPSSTPERSEPEVDTARLDGIETTEEELAAFRIIRAIAAEYVDVDRVTMRDAKSYCAILFDDNNRKPICRLHFMKTKMVVTIYDPAAETREEIEKLSDLYSLRQPIGAALKQYIQ